MVQRYFPKLNRLLFMLNKDNFTPSVKEQAIQWFVKIESGLTTSERRDLVVWCNQDELHHKTLLNLSSSWNDLNALKDLNGLFPLESKKRSHWFKTIIGISLITISLLLVSNQVFNTSPDNMFHGFLAYLNGETNQKYKTHIGEKSTFKLPDGSSITLNTDSIVDIAFYKNHRKLTLVKGEAEFDVQEDLQRPFTVNAGKTSFTALGTIFNVYKESNENIELLVSEGRVLISDTPLAAKQLIKKISTPYLIADDDIVLHSGEKANIENNILKPIQVLTDSQLKQNLAWQNRILIFDGELLKNALAEVSRYTNVKFTIVSPELNQLKISGYFKTDDIEGLLQSLYYNFDIHYKQQNPSNILLMVDS